MEKYGTMTSVEESNMKQIKKIMTALLVAAICLSMVAVAALAESGTVWTTGNVNMRKGPALDYSSIRTISSGVRLEYDKTEKDGRGVRWYRISYKGRTGWVSSKFASEKSSSSSGSSSSSSTSASGKVKTTAGVNMRKGAGTSYSVIRTIPKGVSLSYDKTAKDSKGVTWYHVSYKQRSGWVTSQYAKKGDSSSSSSSSSKSSGSKVKTTGNVHLRTGASLDYRALCTVPKGVTLSFNETKKDGRGVTWYHVSYNGTNGWISSKYAKR